MDITKQQHFKILIFLLSLKVVMGLAFGSDEPSSPRQIPYTINTAEVEGATTISSGLFGGLVPLQGRRSGVFILQNPLSADNPITVVDINKPKTGQVAQDILIWKRKETLAFNAENSARTEIVYGLVDFGVTGNRLAKAYEKISDHPSFAKLRQMFLEEKGYPDNKVRLELLYDLSFEITVDILKDPNSSKPLVNIRFAL